MLLTVSDGSIARVATGGSRALGVREDGELVVVANENVTQDSGGFSTSGAVGAQVGKRAAECSAWAHIRKTIKYS